MKLLALKMSSSRIDEQRYNLLVDYLTVSRDGNRSCIYPAGSTANEKRAIRQQADVLVLKERLLYYRATDAEGEISLKRVIANLINGQS